jgi:hypothetical protein
MLQFEVGEVQRKFADWNSKPDEVVSLLKEGAEAIRPAFADVVSRFEKALCQI